MTPTGTAVRLSRTSSPGDGVIPPVRIVHVGLGAFHRAHQAWYTAHAADAADWGIAAFTGRSPEAARALAEQDGLFTLIERGPRDDRFEIVRSLVEAYPGSDLETFTDLLSRPEVAILTMTLTEAGYRLGADGLPDLADAAVASDLDVLPTGLADSGVALATLAPTTALGRVILGLESRRRAGGPGIAIIPCDNLPENGAVVRGALLWLADAISPRLAAWMREHVAVVSTSVDRITPRTTEADRVVAQDLSGFVDDAVVVTEPFSDWVLSGEFPSGRPDWGSAGARFVDDIRPWESRKLWMLNGAHTALAALGAVRRHVFVSDAMTDPVCRDLVERLWDDDARQLPEVEVETYRAALVERFSNPRLEYRLVQIAQNSATKVRVRILPVASAERRAGRSADGCAAAVAAWILAVRGGYTSAPDGMPADASTMSILGFLDATLGADPQFCAAVDAATIRLNENRRNPS
ncbi:MAG: mannitol dehydrogenase family protein [Pseudolysinimonas sp.]